MAKLLARGDIVDGKIVEYVNPLGSDPIKGDEIALGVHFADDSNAIYLVRSQTVPEPSTMLFLCCGLIGLAVLRLRRRATI